MFMKCLKTKKQTNRGKKTKLCILNIMAWDQNENKK